MIDPLNITAELEEKLEASPPCVIENSPKIKEQPA
jgi:hypothetical protein